MTPQLSNKQHFLLLFILVHSAFIFFIHTSAVGWRVMCKVKSFYATDTTSAVFFCFVHKKILQFDTKASTEWASDWLTLLIYFSLFPSSCFYFGINDITMMLCHWLCHKFLIYVCGGAQAQSCESKLLDILEDEAHQI